jgi:3-methyl-2-oxobutanoate hydroxymethyltransferase
MAPLVDKAKHFSVRDKELSNDVLVSRFTIESRFSNVISRIMKITTQTISLLKGERPVVAVTAYDAVMARYADEAGVDLILVGDSVGTTQLGFKTTVPVTLDMMVHHAAAVTRAKPEALVVADVPFAIAHDEFSKLLEASRRLMQEGGVEAVKIEGDADMAPKVDRLVRAGVPVIAHVGLLPQNYYQLGGYRKFGHNDAEKSQLLNDALAFEEAGCFAVLCELIDSTVAGAIANEIKVPLIGIGSGPHCDGQILVSNDMLGLNAGYVPSFVREYAGLGNEARAAFANYAEDVRKRKFPS